MVFVPEGEFVMGNNDGPNDERPAHIVYLDAFWIDRTEVTNAMYAKCVIEKVCLNPGSSVRLSSPEHPVIGMEWDDAQIYCAWAKARLPTEAEWEKAARGTDERLYPWGNETDSERYRNEPDDYPVGSFPSGVSPYGALDMTGGALEWVYDFYSTTYYQDSPFANPQGPTEGNKHVLRGGWLFSGIGNGRSDFRDGSDTEFHWQYYAGFRCASSE
jgi:serine/threonine-protein kinase